MHNQSKIIGTLSFASRGPEHHHSLGTLFDEEAATGLIIIAFSFM